MTEDLSHLAAEDAASRLAEILKREGQRGGFDTDGITVRSPEESSENCWEVAWEDGPRDWGTYLSSGESIQFALTSQEQWVPEDHRQAGEPFRVEEPGFNMTSRSPEPEIQPHGEDWYLETGWGQNVLFFET